MALSDNLQTTAEAIVPVAPAGATAEQVAARDAAVVQTKKLVEEVMKHIVANAEITLKTSLNDVFTAGVPIAMDGGLALQTAWKGATAAGAADASEIS